MTKDEILKHLKNGEIIEGVNYLFKLDEAGDLVYRLRDSSDTTWKISSVRFNYPESFRIYTPSKKRATNSVKGQLAANAIINGTYF